MGMWKVGDRSVAALCVLWTLSAVVIPVRGSVYVDALLSEEVFESVAYFDFQETKWSFVDAVDILEGPIRVLTASSFDEYFEELQQEQQRQQDSVPSNTTRSDVSTNQVAPHSIYDPEVQLTTPPNFMIVEFASSPYSSSIENIRHVAGWLNVDFVVLVANRETNLMEKIIFWWSHIFPGTYEGELEEDSKTGAPKCYFLALGVTRGQEILSVLEKYESWNIGNGNFYFGIDGMNPIKGSVFSQRLTIYIFLLIALWKVTKNLVDEPLEGEEGTEDYVQFTGEDLGMGEIQTSSEPLDCCVCLEVMPPGAKVRILPCRHAFHEECIDGWFKQKKYSCPLCKMSLRDHLAERRTVAAEMERTDTPTLTWRQRLRQRIWPSRRKIELLNPDALMGAGETTPVEGGDLELTEEGGVVA